MQQIRPSGTADEPVIRLQLQWSSHPHEGSRVRGGPGSGTGQGEGISLANLLHRRISLTNLLHRSSASLGTQVERWARHLLRIHSAYSRSGALRCPVEPAALDSRAHRRPVGESPRARQGEGEVDRLFVEGSAAGDSAEGDAPKKRFRPDPAGRAPTRYLEHVRREAMVHGKVAVTTGAPQPVILAEKMEIGSLPSRFGGVDVP